MIIRKPRSEKTTLSLLDMCNKEHILYEMKIIKKFFKHNNCNIDFIVKAFKIKNNYYFYVFTLEYGCICFCEFIDNSVCRSIYKLNKYKFIFEPHSDTHPDFRGFGLVSNIYTYFLLNVPEAVLVTSKHTKLAASLWESVCRKVKGKIVYHNLITGLEENNPTKSNIKLLIKMLKNSAIAKCNTAIIEGVLVPPAEVKLLHDIYSNRNRDEFINTSIRIHSFTKNDLPATTHSLLIRLVKKKLIHKHEVKDIYNPKKNKKIYMLDGIVVEFFKYHRLHK